MSAFNGVKVFSATMVQDRMMIGERVSEWIANHPDCKIVDMKVTQSSDDKFHMIAISVFYTQPLATRKAATK